MYEKEDLQRLVSALDALYDALYMLKANGSDFVIRDRLSRSLDFESDDQSLYDWFDETLSTVACEGYARIEELED